MNIFNLINDYFLGEKIEALVFILPIGLLSLVLGSWLFVEGGSFFRGVSLPFIVMGLIMSIVGGVVGLRTPDQVAKLEQALKTNPQPTITNEIARMKKVNDAWPKYLFVWTAFAIIGLVLRFLTKNDFAQGLGISLVFFSGVTLLVDGFAERRAVKYTQAISQPVEEYYD